MKSTDASTQELAALLEKRLEVIADRAFMQRDAEGHLAALRGVSHAIDSLFRELKPELPPRLRHFMEQASYTKALEYIRQENAGK
jgi:hypothetical protein